MIDFFIEGKIVPKARPRVTSKGTFMPESYQNWMKGTVWELISIWREKYQSIKLNFPLTLAIHLEGKHSRQGDLDNIGGAVMDALVKAQILPNDNVNCINHLTISFNYSNKPPTYVILLVEDANKINDQQREIDRILVSN